MPPSHVTTSNRHGALWSEYPSHEFPASKAKAQHYNAYVRTDLTQRLYHAMKNSFLHASLSCYLEFLWIHIELAQPRNTAAQLEQCLYALQDLHMREANLLDKLQL